MSWLKRNIGLDWFDLLVQASLTGIAMAIADEIGAPESLLAAVAGVSILVLAARRAWALRRSGGMTGLNSGEMAAMRFEEMEQRLSELESTQARMAELEERLEFAERLLAKSGERLPLAAPEGAKEPIR